MKGSKNGLFDFIIIIIIIIIRWQGNLDRG